MVWILVQHGRRSGREKWATVACPEAKHVVRDWFTTETFYDLIWRFVFYVFPQILFPQFSNLAIRQGNAWIIKKQQLKNKGCNFVSALKYNEVQSACLWNCYREQRCSHSFLFTFMLPQSHTVCSSKAVTVKQFLLIIKISRRISRGLTFWW